MWENMYVKLISIKMALKVDKKNRCDSIIDKKNIMMSLGGVCYGIYYIFELTTELGGGGKS